jgi:hypothetical protein
LKLAHFGVTELAVLACYSTAGKDWGSAQDGLQRLPRGRRRSPSVGDTVLKLIRGSDPTRTHAEIGQHAPDALTGYDLCLARQDARRSPYLCFIVQANRTLITRARIKVATTAAITPLAAQELPTGPADSWNRENPTSRSSFRAAVTISLLAASTISNTAEATSRTDRKTPPYRL